MAIDQADDSKLVELESACLDLRNLLQTSVSMEESLEKMDPKLDAFRETLSTVSREMTSLQSLSIASKALETKINRAVSPALALIDSFKVSESLQRELRDLSSKLSDKRRGEREGEKRLDRVKKYVGYVDSLHVTVDRISQECEPAIQKLQEVVEFLSRINAGGDDDDQQQRTSELRETLISLKGLYEAEVDAMRFDGVLDEALLYLQDEYEGLLQQLRHKNIGDQPKNIDEVVVASSDLGTEMELDVLRQISKTLAQNDCWDICVDIFVRVRYRRAAKALMRLHPDYLRTYTPEEIDEMERESLETAISLWIQHFELAINTVLLSEKKLCNQVLGRGVADGSIWKECFVKMADKIMAVFFRFGEGVAKSNRDPEKLFNLLDMFVSLEKLKSQFSEVFEGESGADISLRFREVWKLIVRAGSRVFWEFGLQIELNRDFSPPRNGSVSNLVRCTMNYLKKLASDSYSEPMSQVLRTDQMWKARILSKPETEENLIKISITNVLEALQRNVEEQRLQYKEDGVLPHIFAMNTYWYIYMKAKNSELGKLLGEQYMRENYKSVAEESAYLYRKEAWGSLVNLLEEKEDDQIIYGVLIRGKMEDFMNGFNEVLQRHRSSYSIPDGVLREQIGKVVVKLVVPSYTLFLNTHASVLHVKSCLSPESIEELLGTVFGAGGGQRERDREVTRRRRNSSDGKEERLRQMGDFSK